MVFFHAHFSVASALVAGLAVGPQGPRYERARKMARAQRQIYRLATAALVPVALISSRGFLKSLGSGIATSWRGKRLWWHIVLAQLLLLGFFVFMTYKYSRTTTSGPTTTMNVSYSFNFRFHHFWAGGYEHDCRWHDEFMKLVGAKPVPVIGRLVWLGFGVLAVVVKLAIVGRLSQLQPAAPNHPVVDLSPAT